MAGYKQLNIRIPNELNEKLRELAYEKRTTKTDIVTRFIEDGIKKESS